MQGAIRGLLDKDFVTNELIEVKNMLYDKIGKGKLLLPIFLLLHH